MKTQPALAPASSPSFRQAAQRRRKAKNASAYRLRGGEPVIGVRVRPIVAEALIAQAIDAGVPESRAEIEARDRRRLAELLEDVQVAWAELYLSERNRHR